MRVGAPALRFTLAETIELVRARCGARVDADACARLHEATEGWPLGLQLALAAIERAPDARTAIGAISARSGDLGAHLLGGLVANLADADAAFLARVAVVDHLHPGPLPRDDRRAGRRRAARASRARHAGARRGGGKRMAAAARARPRRPARALRRAAGGRAGGDPHSRGGVARRARPARGGGAPGVRSGPAGARLRPRRAVPVRDRDPRPPGGGARLARSPPRGRDRSAAAAPARRGVGARFERASRRRGTPGRAHPRAARCRRCPALRVCADPQRRRVLRRRARPLHRTLRPVGRRTRP